MPPGLPEQVELATPFFPQEEYQCGPAALATALVSAGAQTTPEALVPQVYVPERKGSFQVEMLAAARRHGMVSYALAPKFEDLLREIAAGTPVIVLQNLGILLGGLALRGRHRLRLLARHAGPALGDAGTRGDAVRHARAGLDAKRLLGNGGHATGPIGHRGRRKAG